MRTRRLVPILLAGVCLTGCGIFPKEEELQRTPIIQAYQQDEFKMADVKQGDLQLYETIEVVCMNMGESRYSFGVSDLAFEGVYVHLGDRVTPGTKLAELAVSRDDTQVANQSQVLLTAKEAGRVTYLAEVDEGEKSIAGQLMVIVNTNEAFYLNAYTVYWDRFQVGDKATLHIAGADYEAEIIDPRQIGIESYTPQKGQEGPVYFKIDEEGLYLKGEDKGSITILAEEKKDVLYVPKSAITEVNDKEIVYVENEDGIRSVQYVETGMYTDNKVEIVSGLKVGDKVILE